MQFSLRHKKTTVNQMLSSKLWHIGQIYTIPKSIWKKIEKGITISYGATKNKIYFGHRYSITFVKC